MTSTALLSCVDFMIKQADLSNMSYFVEDHAEKRLLSCSSLDGAQFSHA